MGLPDEIGQLRQEALSAFQQAAAQGHAAALEAARIKYLGVKGLLKACMKRLGEVPREEKPAIGKLLNETSQALQQAFEAAQGAVAQPLRSGPVFDITEPLAPDRRPSLGRLHPLTQTINELRDLLGRLGFELAEGPEVEDERHNFDDLNIPKDHPARDAFDTFFLAPRPGVPAGAGRAILRSQTSTVQVRVMETRPPPIRVMAPGRTYRPDKIDATHGSTFHQIEGLVVDHGISMADLRGTLQLFVEGLFGAGTRVRFRPSFFPFTEPSAEMDCSCPACGGAGTGCVVCKYTGWVELGGCGMVDPAVFEALNRARGDRAYDPEVWTGFAFGFGIERMAMRRHGITDMRLFLENDLRFLRQF